MSPAQRRDSHEKLQINRCVSRDGIHAIRATEVLQGLNAPVDDLPNGADLDPESGVVHRLPDLVVVEDDRLDGLNPGCGGFSG